MLVVEGGNDDDESESVRDSRASTMNEEGLAAGIKAAF